MKRAGFALIELMTILVILMVFLFVSSRVFTLTMRQMHAAPVAANRMASVEQIRDRLWRDLWNTVAIGQPDASTLVLLDSKGNQTTWRKDPDGVLSRSTAEAEARWNELGDLSFVRENGAVVIMQKQRAWTLPAPLLRETTP